MKRVAVALFVLIGGASATAAPPPGFGDRVKALRQQIGVPGMAISIVEGKAVTLAEDFGYRALGSPELVDANTIFPTGSTGKAFTVAALGIYHCDDQSIEPAYVIFDLGTDGEVERITMKPVLPLADFSYVYRDLEFTPIEKSK